MQKIVMLSVSFSVIFLLSAGAIAAKEKQDGSKQSFVSTTYGFKIQYEGTLVHESKDEYVIKSFDAGSQTAMSSEVHVFVSQRPFVYLPGTYGGRYYFDDDLRSKAFSSRVISDSMDINGLKFVRDYWAVYGGEGHWEGVINCYTFHDGQYYTISMVHNFLTNLPGELVNGSRTTKQQMQSKLTEAMRDTANSYVDGFNKILASFSITR